METPFGASFALRRMLRSAAVLVPAFSCLNAGFRRSNLKGLVSLKEPVMKGAAVNVHFDARFMVLDLADGRAAHFPLGLFPALESASPAQREHFAISIDQQRLYWPELKQDVSVTALLLPLDESTLH
jgi:hypothetical protein